MKNKLKIIIPIIILVGVVAFFLIRSKQNKEKEYTLTKVNEYNFFILKQNDKYGVIDKQGKTIINPEFDEVRIPNPEKDIFICYENNTSKVLNANNESIYTEYEQVEPVRLKNTESDLMYEKSVLTYMKDEKMGLINFDGKKITDNKYESIETLPTQEGKLLVKQQGKVGIININGYQLVDCNYDQIQIDGYYQDENEYQDAGYLVSNTTEEGYRYGYVNIKGEEIVKPECNELSRIVEIKDKDNVYLLLAINVIEKSGRYGLADINGNIIIPIEYDQIDITGICIYATKSGTTTVFNKLGERLNIDKEISILETDNDKYKIEIYSNDGEISYGILNDKNVEIVPREYSYIEYLSDNYFIACDKKGKLGVIDESNNKKLNIEYTSLHKVEGTDILEAGNSDKGVEEFYSKSIDKICEASNVSSVSVKGNYIYVVNEDETKYIDIEKQQEKQNFEVFTENSLFSKKENGLWGFVNSNQEIVVECKYDKVIEFNKSGYAGIKKDGKWGVINEKGEVIVEPKYQINKENEINLDFIGEYYSVEYGFGEVYYTNQNNEVVQENEF